MKNIQIRFRRLARMAVCALALVSGASAQEPWQSDFNQFLNAIQPYAERAQTPALIAEMTAKFAGKEVIWEGKFASIALNVPRNAKLLNIHVPTRQMSVSGSTRLYTTVDQLEFFPSLANARAWEKLTPNSTVKFRTTLDTPVVKILDFIRYVNFIFGDVELLDPDAKPVILPGGVTNGATFLEGIAPASWITVRGTNLAATTRTWTTKDFQGSQLPRSLDGVSVKVNGKEALVYFISPTQINALAPDDMSRGAVLVTVSNARGSSEGVMANLGQNAPGLFAFDVENRKFAAAVHPDGVYVGRAGLFGNALTSRPVRAGDLILLFGTGFGPTVTPSPAGQLVEVAKPLENPSQFFVRIGGMPAVVEFAGLTASGLYQFNVLIPNLAPGDHLVVAEIGGVSSSGKVSISVMP